MTIDLERERLAQNQTLQQFQLNHQITEMLTVYFSDAVKSYNYGIYCALIPSNQTSKVLSRLSWDLLHGHGKPGAVKYHLNGNEQVEYLRYGNDTGIEPLVIDREFYGIKENYKEISEEFRLFHDLYFDKTQNHYIKIDDYGNEALVAIVESNRIQIRLKEIRQFLAIKEMHLSIQFDYREHSRHSLKELNIEKGGQENQSERICWGLHYGDFSGIGDFQAFSRLLGKHLIAPLPKSKSGFWGYADEPKKNYVDFIIDVDKHGDDVTYTSDPDKLANYFGANPEAPHYLTPVHFQKQVLDKYYQQPSKYSVEDSTLSCGYLWSMYLDNHHDDKVCAWLGDLGRDLPYQEQLHWRSYNISPVGSVSETYFKRQILAQFTDSDRPEHIFRQKYQELSRSCKEHLGWQLLLPLSKDDAHHFQGVRIPSTNEQRDFDEMIIGLTKILIDSLNEKQLNKLLSKEQRSALKGSISRLETALISHGFQGFSTHVLFLRKLQNLRSSGVAHRKGSNYKKIAKEFDIDSQNLRQVFSDILVQALGVLDYFIYVAKSGKMKK